MLNNFLYWLDVAGIKYNFSGEVLLITEKDYNSRDFDRAMYNNYFSVQYRSGQTVRLGDLAGHYITLHLM